MFDNNMNNNQNFNNGTPLFSNNQDNINMNNGYQNGMNGLDNNQNWNFAQPWQQNNNIQNAGVQPYEMYNSGMLSNEYTSPITVSNDVPPDLGEIKNLSDASVASAPTLDVLAPMNIMPESLPPKQDPLDAYESGNLNLQDNNPSMDMNFNNNFQYQNYNTQNPIQTYPDNQFNLNAFNQNLTLNNDYSTMNTNNMLAQPPLSVPNDTYLNMRENQSPYQTNNIYTPSNLEYNQMGSPGFNDFGMNNSLSNSLPPLNNNYNFPSDESFLRENDNIITAENMNETANEEATDEEMSNDYATSENDFMRNLSEVDNTNEEYNDSFDNGESQELGLDKEEPEKSNLEDLGIEADFSEPDTLEIMDIDSDFEQESEVATNELLDEEDGLEEQETKGLVLKNVNKIKELIEELKESGTDIEIEEFDFESMYQLIVKLKK